MHSAVLYGDVDRFADTSSGENSPITIVFSHDMHSHLEKFPKIRTVVKQEKQNNDATFVLDGGDFSMGTPYQTIFKEEAAELRMMGAVGYDATTLGNHEFDYRSAGLTQMLKTAESSGDRVPHLVAANIDWEKTLSDEEMRKDGEALRAAMEDYGAEEYVVIERERRENSRIRSLWKGSRRLRAGERHIFSRSR